MATGLVDTRTTPELLGMVTAGRLDVTPLVTHTFGLDEVEEAYDVFSRPDETGALKVAIRREPDHTSVLPRA